MKLIKYKILTVATVFLLLTACQSARVQEKVEELKTASEVVVNPNAPTSNEIEAVKDVCDEAKTPEEAEACAKIEFNETNAELNRTYGAIMGKLQETMISEATKADKKLLETAKKNIANLKDTQEKWLVYREANCESEKLLAAKDENPNFIGLNCQQRLTEQRTEDLTLIYTK